jgi:ubiquinone/menaquinone biosynthesis C-methylase UbiE
MLNASGCAPNASLEKWRCACVGRGLASARLKSSDVSESSPAYKGRVKYTEANARSYQIRKPGKERAELRLVERAFKVIPRGRVLDAPCGGGRVTLLLAKLGYQMTAGDLSEPMIQITRDKVANEGLKIPVEKQDVEKLTYADNTFDAVISFRLFHHFPNPDIRQRVVRELCRVANQHVALSYFSPYSFTSVQRKRRAARGGKKSDKHATPLSEVTRYFENCGFELVKDFARLNLIHTLHLAVFRRKQA